MAGLTTWAARGLRRLSRALDSSVDEQLWLSPYSLSRTNSGIDVSQVTALSSSAVLACVVILAEDVAKIEPLLVRRNDDRSRDIVVNHPLAKLFRRPNEWMTGFEFREFMMVQLLLRSNAYAVKIRNAGGDVVKLVPINSDRVALWEAPTGDLFYRVTPLGLHEMAQLAGQPFLIPAEDIFHVRGLTLNGLLGSARIVLGKEAIALSLAYEQQAARWMASASRPSGLLSTEQRLTPEAAKRMAADWKDMHSGLQNAAKVAVLEQGLKYQPIAFDAQQMDFIKSRQWQVEDLARMWRIPLHMVGAQTGRGAGSVEQGATEYQNLALSSYTARFGARWDVDFDLTEQGLVIEWNYSILTRADRSSRVAMYSRAIAGGMMTPNEARIDDGLDPLPNGDKLWMPSNVSYAGSQTNGALPDGGGRPEGSPNKDPIDQ